MTPSTTLQLLLRKMRISMSEGRDDAHDTEYRLPTGDPAAADCDWLAVNDWLGRDLRVRFLGSYECTQCGAVTRRSYGQGHCYECFTTLASCDLCIRSPDRCHFHLGTCREPEWGQGFCMQPHLVYLANSGGLKVGITKQANLPGRWLDQGAAEGLVVARTATRRLAGLLEVACGQWLSDRTDWRKMVRGDIPVLDLVAQALTLQERAAPIVAQLLEEHGPDAVSLVPPLAPDATRLHYPAAPEAGYALRPQTRLNLDKDELFEGRLLGLRGQYWLLDSGVFNVQAHSGYCVELTLDPSERLVLSSQQSLF